MATQEELILKQFAAGKSQLAQKRKAAQEQLGQDLQRRQAISGMTGGAAVKAAAKGARNLEEGFSTAEAELSGQEAAQLRQAMAEKEAKEFQRAEREAGQLFASGESEKGRGFASTEAEKGRQFQSGERLGSQQFASAERLAQQAFQSAEANIGRQFSSSERQAIQDFQAAQQQGAQNFAAAESALGRQFTTAERNAIQNFQSAQADIQRQYQTGERLGGQAFAGEQAARQRAFQEAEAGKERAQQASQFQQAFGLQGRQFEESQRQFDQQMSYQLAELAENKITNIINAITAFEKSDLANNPAEFKTLIDRIKTIREKQFA